MIVTDGHKIILHPVGQIASRLGGEIRGLIATGELPSAIRK
jgi:hypothetical protein